MNEPIIFALALAALSSGQSVAETATPMSNTDTDTQLSKEIENPVTRRITLPLRYEADFLDGAYRGHQGHLPDRPSGFALPLEP